MKPKTCSECGFTGNMFKSSPLLCASCARKTYRPKVGDITQYGQIICIKPTIAPLSKKRVKHDRAYQRLRKIYLENHPTCKAQLGNCTGNSGEIHHQKGRIEQLLTDVRYFLPVCRNCHDWIEMNSAKAKELGLSISRLTV